MAGDLVLLDGELDEATGKQVLHRSLVVLKNSRLIQ